MTTDLATENEILRERIRQLEAFISETDPFPQEWRLTPVQKRILSILLRREFVSRDMIMSALYDDRIGDEPFVKIIDVFICLIRKKLTPLGIQIETRWGQGYFMTSEAKAHARRLMRPVEQVAA